LFSGGITLRAAGAEDKPLPGSKLSADSRLSVRKIVTASASMAGAAYVDATTWPVRQGSRSRYLSGDGGQPAGT